MSKNSPELLNLRNTRVEVIKKIHAEGLSIRGIALKFSVSRTAIQNYFKINGIKNRTIAESQTAMNNSRIKALSFLQEQLLLGSLLGDACLSYGKFISKWTGRKLSCYKLCFSHTEKHLEYLKHKKSLLGNGIKGPLKIGTRISGHGSIMRFFSFSYTPILKKYAEICHDRDHKKALSKEWLDRVDWPAIAYWYQDDGSLSLKKYGYKTISFHTESFKPAEIVLLQELLLKFGLDTTLGYNGHISQQIILAHKQEQIKMFFEKIKPYVVPCMLYKLRDSGLYRKGKVRDAINKM